MTSDQPKPSPVNYDRAGYRADWQQVVLNQGPPCFFLEQDRFCLRAERWQGHPNQHGFISLPALLDQVRAEEREKWMLNCESEADARIAQVAERDQRIAELEKRHKDFLDGYFSASKQVEEALGTCEAFEQIDREFWESGVGAWHRFIVAKIEHLRADLARAEKRIKELEGRGE